MDELWPTPQGDNPPSKWLLEPHPELSSETPMIIDQEGRFSAISHEWDTQHISIPEFKPKRSPSGNKSFHQGTTITAEGKAIPTGVISYGGGHVAVDLPAHIVRKMNGDPSRVKIAARCVELDKYAAVCGYVVPGTTKKEVASMLRSTLSGEWRSFNGRMDYWGPVFVDRGGLPKGVRSQLTDKQIESKFDKIAKNYYSVKSPDGDLVYACAAPLALSFNDVNIEKEIIVTANLGSKRKFDLPVDQISSIVASEVSKVITAMGEEEMEASMEAHVMELDSRIEVLEAAVVALQSAVEDSGDLAEELPE